MSTPCSGWPSRKALPIATLSCGLLGGGGAALNYQGPLCDSQLPATLTCLPAPA
jgi:hypothetical protein